MYTSVHSLVPRPSSISSPLSHATSRESSVHCEASILINCFNFGGKGRCTVLRFSSEDFSPIVRRHSRRKRRKRHVLLKKMSFQVDDFTISEELVKVAKDVFKKFDKRGQEKISTNDLGPAFRALNLTVKPDTLKEWADLVDDDASGFIDLNGFLICYGKKLAEDQDERDMREAFRVLDKNRRGEIPVEDLRWILTSLGDDLSEEEVEAMIRDTDTDGSGFVDFDEFYKLMTS